MPNLLEFDSGVQLAVVPGVKMSRSSGEVQDELGGDGIVCGG
jgi:hypothetical protein